MTVVRKGPGTVRWKVTEAVKWTAAGVRDKRAEKKATAEKPDKKA
jgi:hypothetical protein